MVLLSSPEKKIDIALPLPPSSLPSKDGKRGHVSLLSRVPGRLVWIPEVFSSLCLQPKRRPTDSSFSSFRKSRVPLTLFSSRLRIGVHLGVAFFFLFFFFFPLQTKNKWRVPFPPRQFSRGTKTRLFSLSPPSSLSAPWTRRWTPSPFLFFPRLRCGERESGRKQTGPLPLSFFPFVNHCSVRRPTEMGSPPPFPFCLFSYRTSTAEVADAATVLLLERKNRWRTRKTASSFMIYFRSH